MQEQNFEKQVQKIMEELSFAPTDPVWKKIEAEIRTKRDRRRLLFWLPLAFLFFGAGVWIINNKTNHTVELSGTNISNDQKNKEIERQLPSEDRKTKEYNIHPSIIAKKTEQPQNTKMVLVEKSTKPTVVNAKTGQQKTNTDPTNSFGDNFIKPEREESIKKQHSESFSQGEPNRVNNATVSGNNKLAENIQSPDSVSSQITPSNNESSIDTNSTKLPDPTPAKDSLPQEKITHKLNKDSKWKLAIAAGVGHSGVSNGAGLFGGGAKSLESNAFVADRNYSSGQLTSFPNNTYRPPSEQKKSLSLFWGLLVKKKTGKRSAFSAGLQYNFYSTKLLVGQSMHQDTMASAALRVKQFYANSGPGFSEYQNKFHFISVPLAFDFQIIKKLPVDFHIGLSIQQLLKTNALLYSASSQIYYSDNDAFNKTYLFSEAGLLYSVPLKKKGVFQFGPKFSYAHSQMGKDSFKRHLFSYGLATQFVFSGK